MSAALKNMMKRLQLDAADSGERVSRSVADPGTITRAFLRERPDTDVALGDAVAAAYNDLRRIAGRLMLNERRSPTFDTTALIHEVYLRLVAQDRTRWRNRRHLFAVAARIMRRTLVDRARRRLAAKRGGGRIEITTLAGKQIAADNGRLDVLALEDALADLARHDGNLAQIVELRFFGGLTNPEIAEMQAVTTMTVIRRWRLARAWLQRRLGPTPP